MNGTRKDHPSKEITGTRGTQLQGRKIVLCITGSVAAYKAIDLARLLMRHGADVHAVMTESTSSLLLTAEMMKWSTGNDVVTKLTGDLEHIMLADYGKSDLILVYPCTANTISKIAHGIDDTPVTSVLSVALGSKIPVIVAPAMHKAMYENGIIRENLQRLRDYGVFFVGPNISEDKAKVAEPSQILGKVLNTLSAGPLTGKNVLVTAGSSIEHIDPIRVITNMSSGKMGIAIAQEAKKMGANVTLIYGRGSTEPDEFHNGIVSRVSTGKEMRDAVVSELGSRNYDIVIMAAAVADFAPVKRSNKKIDTRTGKIELTLVSTKKIVDDIKKLSKNTILVAFKADYKVSESILIEKAYSKLQESGADLVVANDLGRKGSEVGSDRNEVFIVDKKKKVIHIPLQSKVAVARKILDTVARVSERIS